jgi:predicted nucleotidyltransferase
MSHDLDRSATTHEPTPYADVNAVLDLLLRESRAILGERFVGMYLYGSLSSGDFDPGSSDIDFLVVTTERLPESILDELRSMHARIAASDLKWATKLEGSYIPLAAIRRHDPDDMLHPSIGVDWEFGVGPHRTDWIFQRHILRESGVTLAGPPPHALIDPVSPDELRMAVQTNLRDYWAKQLDGPEWLRRRDYQAFAILTMCRSLYTLHHGAIVSKPVAAAWAHESLGAPWAELIDRSLAWRHDSRPDDMTEMLAFVRWVVEQHTAR